MGQREKDRPPAPGLTGPEGWDAAASARELAKKWDAAHEREQRRKAIKEELAELPIPVTCGGLAPFRSRKAYEANEAKRERLTRELAELDVKAPAAEGIPCPTECPRCQDLVMWNEDQRKLDGEVYHARCLTEEELARSKRHRERGGCHKEGR